MVNCTTPTETTMEAARALLSLSTEWETCSKAQKWLRLDGQRTSIGQGRRKGGAANEVRIVLEKVGS